MKKKIFSMLMTGALLIASASMVTSCKDYDDDINDLQTQIDANKTSLSQLVAQHIAEANSRIAALEANVKSLDEAYKKADQALQEAITKISNDLQGYATLQQLEAAKAEYQAAIKSLNEAKAALEAAVADAQARLGKLEADNEVNKNNIQALLEKDVELTAAIKDAAALAQNAYNLATQADNQSKANAIMLGELAKQIEATNKDVADKYAELSKLLGDETGNIAETLQNLQGTVNGLQTTLTAWGAQLTVAYEAASKNSADIVAHQFLIEALQKDLADAKKALTERDDYLQAQVTKAQATADSLAEVTTKIQEQAEANLAEAKRFASAEAAKVLAKLDGFLGEYTGTVADLQKEFADADKILQDQIDQLGKDLEQAITDLKKYADNKAGKAYEAAVAWVQANIYSKSDIDAFIAAIRGGAAEDVTLKSLLDALEELKTKEANDYADFNNYRVEANGRLKALEDYDIANDLKWAAYNTWKEAVDKDIQTFRDSIKIVDDKVNDALDQLSKVNAYMDNLNSNFSKLITGLIAQFTYSYESGSYMRFVDSWDDERSMELVALYGVPGGNRIFFPAGNKQDGISQGSVLISSSVNTLVNDIEDNAGSVFLTINPGSIDFDGQDGKLSLVDSKDNAAPVKLSKLHKANNTTATMWGNYYKEDTRAVEKNGFYYVDASVKVEDLDKFIDYRDNWNYGEFPAYALKSSYSTVDKDGIETEHAVYSQYGIMLYKQQYNSQNTYIDLLYVAEGNRAANGGLYTEYNYPVKGDYYPAVSDVQNDPLQITLPFEATDDDFKADLLLEGNYGTVLRKYIQVVAMIAPDKTTEGTGTSYTFNGKNAKQAMDLANVEANNFNKVIKGTEMEATLKSSKDFIGWTYVIAYQLIDLNGNTVSTGKRYVRFEQPLFDATEIAFADAPKRNGVDTSYVDTLSTPKKFVELEWVLDATSTTPNNNYLKWANAVDSVAVVCNDPNFPGLNATQNGAAIAFQFATRQYGKSDTRNILEANATAGSTDFPVYYDNGNGYGYKLAAFPKNTSSSQLNRNLKNMRIVYDASVIDPNYKYTFKLRFLDRNGLIVNELTVNFTELIPTVYDGIAKPIQAAFDEAYTRTVAWAELSPNRAQYHAHDLYAVNATNPGAAGYYNIVRSFYKLNEPVKGTQEEPGVIVMNEDNAYSNNNNRPDVREQPRYEFRENGLYTMGVEPSVVKNHEDYLYHIGVQYYGNPKLVSYGLTDPTGKAFTQFYIEWRSPIEWAAQKVAENLKDKVYQIQYGSSLTLPAEDFQWQDPTYGTGMTNQIIYLLGANWDARVYRANLDFADDNDTNNGLFVDATASGNLPMPINFQGNDNKTGSSNATTGTPEFTLYAAGNNSMTAQPIVKFNLTITDVWGCSVTIPLQIQVVRDINPQGGAKRK